MSDNNSLSQLLSWVNNQRKGQGTTPIIYNFQQLKKTPFLYDLLQRIHPSYFQALNHLSFDFQPYFTSLENYLIELQGKKMKRGYKRSIVEQQSISEIIRIVLYLLLQSAHKTQYINRIFEMDVELQGCLMVQLQRVDQSLENYIEIKDILATVEKLEEENEELKDRLRGINETARSLQETVMQTKQENQRIEKEVSKYENQKKVIMEELHILDMRDYIQIYKSVRQENDDLTRCIHEAEQRRKDIESENYSLKERIGEDCQTITSLNQEIQKIRTNYERAKDEVSILSISKDNTSFQDSVLRENKNINNTITRNSIQGSCSNGNSKILWQLDEDQNQCQRLRNYNREIMEKLESAYRSISELNDQVQRLKVEKVKVEKKNQFLDRKITDIKKEQSRFVKELRKMGI